VGVAKVVIALYLYKVRPIIYKSKICISFRLILGRAGKKNSRVIRNVVVHVY